MSAKRRKPSYESHIGRGLPVPKTGFDLSDVMKPTEHKRRKGMMRPARSKKIAANRERVFQAELARIKGIDTPKLDKEKKLPRPQIIRPKPEPEKPKFLDQIREALHGPRIQRP